MQKKTKTAAPGADAAATGWQEIESWDILFPLFVDNGLLTVPGLLTCLQVCTHWRSQVNTALTRVKVLSFRPWHGRVHAADVLRVLDRMGKHLRLVDLRGCVTIGAKRRFRVWQDAKEGDGDDEDDDDDDDDDDVYEMEEEKEVEDVGDVQTEDGGSRDQALAARQPGMQDILRLIHESFPGVIEVDVSGCRSVAVLQAVAVLASMILTDSRSDGYTEREDRSNSAPRDRSRVDFERILTFVSEGTPRLIMDPGFVPQKDPFWAHTAAKEGCAALIRFLARIRVAGESTPIVNKQFPSGWTAAHYAAKVGDVAVLLALVDADADFTGTDLHGRTSLMVAIQNGHAAAAELLIEPTRDALDQQIVCVCVRARVRVRVVVRAGLLAYVIVFVCARVCAYGMW